MSVGNPSFMLQWEEAPKKPRAARIDPKLWDEQRDLIHELYIVQDKSLQYTLGEIQKPPQFTPTRKQLVKVLDDWGFHKYDTKARPKDQRIHGLLDVSSRAPMDTGTSEDLQVRTAATDAEPAEQALYNFLDWLRSPTNDDQLSLPEDGDVQMEDLPTNTVRHLLRANIVRAQATPAPDTGPAKQRADIVSDWMRYPSNDDQIGRQEHGNVEMEDRPMTTAEPLPPADVARAHATAQREDNEVTMSRLSAPPRSTITPVFTRHDLHHDVNKLSYYHKGMVKFAADYLFTYGRPEDAFPLYYFLLKDEAWSSDFSLQLSALRSAVLTVHQVLICRLRRQWIAQDERRTPIEVDPTAELEGHSLEEYAIHLSIGAALPASDETVAERDWTLRAIRSAILVYLGSDQPLASGAKELGGEVRHILETIEPRIMSISENFEAVYPRNPHVRWAFYGKHDVAKRLRSVLCQDWDSVRSTPLPFYGVHLLSSESPGVTASEFLMITLLMLVDRARIPLEATPDNKTLLRDVAVAAADLRKMTDSVLYDRFLDSATCWLTEGIEFHRTCERGATDSVSRVLREEVWISIPQEWIKQQRRAALLSTL